MIEKRFTVEEMQNWNKRYKLDKETAKCVIDTFDGGEYWTVHGNEAYNLCIDMNALYDENEQLKSEIEKLSYANEDLLSEKRNWQRMSDEYCNLSDENEQLKKENNELKEKNEFLQKRIDCIIQSLQNDLNNYGMMGRFE